MKSLAMNTFYSAHTHNKTQKQQDKNTTREVKSHVVAYYYC